MENFTYERSVEAARPVKAMNDLAEQLDVEYLTGALEEMKKNHSMRDSIMILNPSPFTHTEQQELDAAKLEQLDLMLKLSKNVNRIKELTLKLYTAKGRVNDLSKMFGG
jgi:hypothetical protein